MSSMDLRVGWRKQGEGEAGKNECPPPSIEHNCAFHLPTFSVNVELELHQNFGRHHFAKKVSKKIWS